MNRVAWGVSIFTIGLGIAALAGIPDFLAGTAAGAVVVVAGLTTCTVGVVVGLFGIPEARRNRARNEAERVVAERAREAEVEQLRYRRDQLYADKIDALAKLAVAMHHLEVAQSYGDGLRAAQLQADLKRAQSDSSHVERELGINAQDFRRYGLEPESHD